MGEIAEVEVSILGPLSLSVGGREAEVRGVRQRALLAILALEANRAVAADTLVARLWGDASAGSPVSLRSCISRLRAALRTESRRLRTEPPGYRLDLLAGELDSSAFEACLKSSKDLPPDRVVDILDSALAAWRGQPLAEFLPSPWAVRASARLGELRLEAVERRLEALLTLGEHQGVVPELVELAEANPLRERLWRLLMVALYRSGRQAEALRAYARLREALVSQLGLNPSPELAGLERDILRQEPTLSWAPLDRRSSPPFPAELVEACYPARFVGRGPELRLLGAARKEARMGEAQMVLISGEAGIGKTAVVARMAKRAWSEGDTVLYGRCTPDPGHPYQPIVEALAGFVAGLPTGSSVERLGHDPAELARMEPSVLGALPPALEVRWAQRGDPDADRYRLFSAVASWLSSLGEAGNAILVIEDLQWAGRPMLAMLEHVLRAAGAASLLVVATYRDNEVPPGDPSASFLAESRRQKRVARVELSGLGQDEVAELASQFAEAAGAEASEELVAAVAREAGGNPFFVTEMLRHIAESGRLTSRARPATPDQDVGGPELPTSVREVLNHRVARLGPRVQAVLELAAVVGQDFELPVLSRAMGTAEDELVGDLRRATASGLVVDVAPGRYRFAHALSNHGLYAGMGPTARARAHGRVAGALGDLAEEGAEVPAGVLAHHWGLAAPLSGVDKAASWAVRAGEAALAQLAPDQAVEWFRLGLELQDGAQTHDGARRAEPGAALARCSLLVRLGEAERQAGYVGFRETLLEAGELAKSVGDHELMAAAALANHRGGSSRSGEVDSALVDALEAALEVTNGTAPATRGRLCSMLATELVYAEGSWPRRRRLADQAIAMASRTDDAEARVGIMSDCFTALQSPLTLEERREISAEALSLAERTGHPVLRLNVLADRIAACFEAGDLAGTDWSMDSYDEEVEPLHLPFYGWVSRFNRAWRALLAGRLEDAERLVGEALQLGTECGQPDAVIVFAGQLGMVRYDQGRLGEMEELGAELAAASPGFAVIRPFLALIHCEADRRSEALELLEADARSGFNAFGMDNLWLFSLCIYAEVCCELGERAAAEVLYEKLRPWEHQVSFTLAHTFGSVARPLGRLAGALGWYDRAEQHYGTAMAVHERLGAPVWLSRTRLDRATTLMGRGGPDDAARARDLALSALLTAADLGCAGISRRAREVLSVPA